MKFVKGDVAVHLKTAGEYTIEDKGQWVGNCVECYSYRSNTSGLLWFRTAEEMEDGRFVLKVKSESEMFGLLALKQALKLEILGMKRASKPSAFIQAKRLLKEKGDKKVILSKLQEHIDDCTFDIGRVQESHSGSNKVRS